MIDTLFDKRLFEIESLMIFEIAFNCLSWRHWMSKLWLISSKTYDIEWTTMTRNALIICVSICSNQYFISTSFESSLIFNNFDIYYKFVRNFFLKKICELIFRIRIKFNKIAKIFSSKSKSQWSRIRFAILSFSHLNSICIL